MNLEEIFNLYNISLKNEDQLRNVIDVLEDMYLKLNLEEYQKLMKAISESEKLYGPIFDKTRNKPYE